MLGVNGPEFIVLAVIALLVIGPERLPDYAAQLGRLVREAKRMASGAKQQVRDELGSDFDDIDWQKLDPRQYDPRRIVREALSDLTDDDQPVRARRPAASSARSSAAGSTAVAGAAGAVAAGVVAAGMGGADKPAVRPGQRSAGGAGRPGDAQGPAPFDTEAT